MGFFLKMIKLNPNEISFPDPQYFESDTGLIAFGGDLSPERIWFAYQNGIFPWFNPDEEILWWFPNPRFVLFPKNVKISKSMKKVLKSGQFSFTKNKNFREVMQNCQNIERNGEKGSWISEELIESFVTLHNAGKASSYEVWEKGELVGGFYGVEVGNIFCGESMFSKVSNASKAVFLNFILENKEKYTLIDCQIHSEHLESLGAEMIPGNHYLKILKNES